MHSTDDISGHLTINFVWLILYYYIKSPTSWPTCLDSLQLLLHRYAHTKRPQPTIYKQLFNTAKNNESLISLSAIDFYRSHRNEEIEVMSRNQLVCTKTWITYLLIANNSQEQALPPIPPTFSAVFIQQQLLFQMHAYRQVRNCHRVYWQL